MSDERLVTGERVNDGDRAELGERAIHDERTCGGERKYGEERKRDGVKSRLSQETTGMGRTHCAESEALLRRWPSIDECVDCGEWSRVDERTRHRKGCLEQGIRRPPQLVHDMLATIDADRALLEGVKIKVECRPCEALYQSTTCLDRNIPPGLRCWRCVILVFLEGN